MTKYEPGTPSWVDLGSPDTDASRAFYGALFGWESQVTADPNAGGYTMFTLRGKNVAGLGPLMNEAQPTAWTTYVSVVDADATVAKVKDAGGMVFVEPMDVLDVGRMAIFADPTGAVIAVWQPRAHIGADLVNEPGTFCWNELATRDIETAKKFYEAVFGWGGDTNAFGPGTYTEWKVGERTVGGMMEIGEHMPAEMPAHWLVYFAVADCDATVDKAKELGGAVLVPPTDIPPGRFAVLADPQGAPLAVMKLAEGLG
ncbi:MAG TPA: VOC family protein [Acidimicrobiales bacterium]|nr:VOC family protein [Acidimicrobiales bacterium]